MENKRVKTLSLLGMILVVILWGLAPLAGKYVMGNGYCTPALLIAIRGLISVLFLGAFLLFSGRFKKLDRSYWICLPAGLIMGSAYLLQFIGLDSTTLSKNTFLESFSVIAVPLTMLILTRKRPNILSWIASAGCLFGAFVLCGNGFDFSAFLTAPTLGDILSGVAGILFGVNIAFTKVFVKGKDPYLFVFFQLLVMTVMSFAYSLPFEKGITFVWHYENILLILFLSLVCTIGCWVLRAVCIGNVSAVTTAVLNPMSAVIATSISMASMMEAFSWNVVVGGLIITISILLSGLVDAHLERKERAPLANPDDLIG